MLQGAGTPRRTLPAPSRMENGPSRDRALGLAFPPRRPVSVWLLVFALCYGCGSVPASAKLATFLTR